METEGVPGILYDALQARRTGATEVSGFGIPDGGHFITEEATEILRDVIIPYNERKQNNRQNVSSKQDRLACGRRAFSNASPPEGFCDEGYSGSLD